MTMAKKYLLSLPKGFFIQPTRGSLGSKEVENPHLQKR
jgi:hypothetical protein